MEKGLGKEGQVPRPRGRNEPGLFGEDEQEGCVTDSESKGEVNG